MKTHIDLNTLLENRLITYYSKVLLDRQLPDVRDGLKTSQRRILYTMHVDKVFSNKKFVKSMRITGNVSRIHPHGDCYPALANLISPYNIMQPLLEGHGGFHNILGKPSSASRYTEARLNKFSEEFMLKNIDKRISPFKPDFDQTGEEPAALPAKAPLLLVNGVSAIGAGGFSSYLPTHSFESVVAYMKDLIDHPDKDGKALIIDNKLYPDFPSGGIMDKTQIPSIYETGTGSFTLYAKLEIDTESHPRHDIIRVLEIPYETKLDQDVIKPLVALTQGKATPQTKVVNKDLKEEFSVIKDLKDRSKDGKIIDLSIHVAKGTDLPAFVAKLQKRLTGFKKTILVNMNFINDGRLYQYTSLKDVALDWLTYRRSVVLNEKMVELREYEKRKSILEATNLVVGDDSNRKTYLELANSAKNRVDLGKKLLATWYHLNEIQIEFLTGLRIYNISKDDLAGYSQEIQSLEEKIAGSLIFFKDKTKVDQLIKEDLDAILASGYVEPRLYRTTYQEGIDKELSKADIPDEQFLLIGTSNNFIKKIQLDSLATTQKRSGKGRSLGKFKEGAYPTVLKEANSKDSLLYITKQGNVFRGEVSDIPVTASVNNLGVSILAKLKGQALSNILTVGTEDTDLKDPNLAFLLVTKKNRVKVTPLNQFSIIPKSGLRLISLDGDDDEVIHVQLVDLRYDFNLVAISSEGNVLNVNKADLPVVGRNAAGCKLFATKKGHAEPRVVNADTWSHESANTLVILTEQGRGKLVALDKFPTAKRYTTGLLGINLKDTDKVAYMGVTYQNEQRLVETRLNVISNKKTLTFTLSNLKYMERPALGLLVKKNDADEKIVTAQLLS